MTLTRITTDAHIEIDLNLPYVSRRDPEQFAKHLESEARDVKNFLKDHRSMDIHDVYVVREYGYQCSHCKRINSESESKTPECCEAAIREWATPAQLVEFGYEEG